MEALRVKEASSHTNSDGLWALIAGHVDGGSGSAGCDDQGRIQQIQLDQDITGWGAVMVVHLDLDKLQFFTHSDSAEQTQDTKETCNFSRQIVNTEDGPYCKVEGQARFEVLWCVFEGYDIGRLHNFNASLLCFNQITACTGEKTGSNSSKSLPIATNLNNFINLDSKVPCDILTFYTMSTDKHSQMICLQFLKGNCRLYFILCSKNKCFFNAVPRCLYE